MSGIGWGSGSWGSSSWGSFDADALALAKVVAVRENAVRLIFTRPVYYSGVLDLHDASQPELYAVTPVLGTVGLDGSPARAVTPVEVDLVTLPGLLRGQVLDVVLDRPMTAYPAGYTVDVSDRLLTADMGTQISVTEATMLGVFKEVVQPSIESPTPRRDVANPQSAAGAVVGATTTLGAFATDGSGDYAFDEGSASFKKRLFRRCMTKKGAFLHLPGYGLGLPGYGKRLALAGVRSQIVADAEVQVAREPEVAKVVAGSTFNQTGLFKLILRLKTRGGALSRYEVPFQT